MFKWISVCLMMLMCPALADDFEFTDLSSSPHALIVANADLVVNDKQIGLDALQKRLGQWGFEKSLRVSGQLSEVTYQIVDGYSAAELLQAQVEALKEKQQISPLFECEGRDCGRSVQWASRVFGQRLLYGQDNDQRYWVGQSTQSDQSIYVAYSAYRTESRQYLILQRIKLDSPSTE